MKPGATSRLRVLLQDEAKLAYFKLNTQTPCPPRGAVPVNQDQMDNHDGTRLAFCTTMPQALKRMVSKVVASLGYQQGPSVNWYKQFPELIHVIGLQKSRWGGEYYLEVGIWLKSLGADESPKYYECHVRLRLDSDSGLCLGEIDSALREEDFWKMDEEERLRIITTALEATETAFLDKAQTLETLRRFLSGQHNLNLGVDKRVWQLLRIPNRL